MNSHKVGLVIAPVVALAQFTDIDDHGINQRQARINGERLIFHKRGQIQRHTQIARNGIEPEVNGWLKPGMRMWVSHCKYFHD